MAAAKEKPEESAEAVAAPEVKTVTLDLRYYNCPTPLLLVNDALRKLPSGSFVRAVTTDPLSWNDFRVFAANRGHALERVERGSAKFFKICKK